MKKIYLLLIFSLLAIVAEGQVIAVDPAGDGGFETGTTFAANGWTTVNPGAQALWQIGTVATGYTGSRGVFVGPNATTYSYNTGAARACHFYRDVAIPTGATSITLSWSLIGNGETGWDRLLVYTAPTSVTPTANSPSSSSTTISGATLRYTQSSYFGSYTSQTVSLPVSLAGTTVRLIFTWQNDASGGSTPPAAVDNISLTYCMVGISGTASICQSATTSLTGATGGGAWTSSNSAVGTISSAGVVTGVAGGTTTISYTLGSCVGTQVVTVNAGPAAITGTTTVCNGFTTTLSDASSGGTWSSDATSVATIGSSTGIVTGLSSGTAGITYSNGCGAPATAVITVNSNPTAITGASTVCMGATTTLTDATGSGTWSSSSTGIATVGSSSGVVSGVAGGNAMISYTLATGCYTVAPVFSSPAPPLSVSATPSTYCSGNSANLTATSSVSNYSVYNTAFAPVSFTPTATFTNASTPTSGSNDQGYYTATLPFDFSIYGVNYTAGSNIYIGTNGYLSFSTGYTSDNVFTMPTTSFTALISVLGRDMNLTASPAGQAITYGTTGTAPNRKFVVNFVAVDYFTSNIENAQIVLNETTGIVELHVTTALATTHTLGIQNATGTVAATVPGQNYSSTPITNSSWMLVWPQATSYAWTPTTGLSSSTISNPVTTTTTTTTYTVTGTFNGCSTALSQLVSVNPTPASITGTYSACVGGTSALASATGGGVWSSSDGTVATVNSSGLVSAVAVGVATITYASSGCNVTASFTVNAAPGSSNTGTMTLCTGTTTTLANSGGAGTWTSSSTSIATVGSSTGIVSGVAAGTSTISYVNGCGSYVTSVVTVNQTPAAIAGSSNVCPSTTITLTNANTGGAWTSSDASKATVGGATGIVTGVATGNVTITYDLGNGCAITTKAVAVNLAPAGLSISPATSATICMGSSYSLTASTVPTVNVLAQNWDGGMTGSIGGAWSITNIAGNSSSYWQLRTPPGWASVVGGDGSQYMEAAGDALNGVTNTLVNSPSFSTVGYGAASLQFNQYYQAYGADATVAIEYSVDGGTSWSNLSNQIGTTTGATTWSIGTPNTTVSLPAAALNKSDVRLRWNYVTNYGWYWAIDNIVVVATYPAVTGYVWAGVSGASGLSCSSCAATTVTPTATGANVYSITATNSLGCTSISGATLNVNPSPAAITGTLNVCTTGTSTLSDATSGGVWSSTVGSIAAVDPSTGIVTAGSTVGTTTISYTASGCAATATFAVNASPGAITGTTVFCTGTTTSLANSGGAGIWTSDNTGVATAGSTTGVISGVAVGTATISYVNGCGTYVTSVVTVNQTPAAITGSAGTCIGATATLASTTSGGTWSSNNTSVGTITLSTGIFSGVAAGSTVVSYTLSNGCAAATRTQNVNLAPPTVTVTPSSGTVCLGSGNTFTASTAPTVNVLVQDWNSGMTGSVGGTWNITNLSGTSGSYWQIYSSPGYAGITGDGSAMMEAAPDATGSGINTNTIVTSPAFSLGGYTAASLTLNQYCNSSSSYDALVAIEYSTDGGTTWATLNNQYNTTTGSTTWTASTPNTTVAMPAAAMGQNNVMVRFNYNSTWGFEWAIDNIKVTATYTVPTYAWAGVSGATGLSCTNCAASTITPTATGSNVYSVAATANGCTSTSGVTVSVNPVPTAAPTNNGPICNSGTVNLAANPANGASVFTWSGANLAATTGATPSATPTTTATYSLTVSDGSGNPGCSPSTIYTTSVTVNAKPTAAPTNTSPICNGGTVSFTANPGGSTTNYTWSGSNLSATNVANPTATPTTTTTYSLTVTNGTAASGCSSSYTTTATVNPVPVAAPTNSGPICNGGTVTLTANPSGGANTYSWTGPNLSSATAANPTATPTTTTTYSLTVTNGTAASGCSPSTVYTTTVTVDLQPTAAPTNSSPICNTGTVNFTANPGGSTNTYTWSGSNLSATNIANPSASPTTTATYSLTVTNGTANSGCSSSYTTTATVNPTPVAAPTNNGPICNGGTVTLTANPSGGANTYSWSGPNLSSAIVANPTATPTATATYSLTVTNGTAASGCSPTTIYTTTVTVNPTPVATPANDGPICNTGTVNLTANPSGGATTYSWSGSNLSATNVANPTATPTTTSIYSLTVTNGTAASGCSPSTIYTTSVTVDTKPTAAPTNSSPICNGGTVTFAANPGGSTNTYTWSGLNLSANNVANPTATPTTTATYSLTVTNGTAASGCSSSYTTIVTVNPIPVAAPSNSGPICNGGTVTLTANPSGGANTYSWSGPNLSSAVVANPTATPTATATYSLTVTNGTAASGCSPTTIYTTTVTVNPTPVAGPTNNSPICNGGTVALTANPGGGANTYSWSGANLSSTTAQNPTATPTTTSVYSLVVTNGTAASGCAPSTVYTTSVTVNSTPTAAPTNSGVICKGGTVTLTANPSGGANTYSWSGPSLSSAIAQNPTATPTATATYSLTVSDGTGNPGCSPTTIYTTIVTVNPTPVATPTNNGHICVGGTVNLAANGSGGASVFTWSGANLAATTGAAPTATPSTTSVYSLTVSDGTANSGCSPSTVYTTSVTVNSVPTAAPTNNSPICVGGTVALTANPANGANTYTWSGSSLSGAAAQNPTATPATTSVYSLVVSDGSGHSGCSPSTVYTTSVTVNSAPTLTSASNNGPICAGTTLNLSANGAANVTGYSWSGPVAITGATTASASIPSATTAASGIYTVTVNNNTGSGCTTTYTTSATVNALPTVASITPSSTNMCVGTALTLTAGSVNGTGSLTSYNWSGPNGYNTTTAGSTASFTPATTAASGSYTLSVTYPGGGCTSNATTSAAVTVNNLPTVSSINVSPTVLCANNPITLTGAGASGAGSLVSYNWTGPNSYSSTTAASVQTYTVPSASASGVYSLSVTYTGTGCTSAQVASNTLTVNPLPTAYNVTGGGFYCSGGSGVHVGLSSSDAGINYQLYNGSSAVGVPVAGTGVAIDFGLQTAAGTYSVVGTNATSSCTNAMTGTTTVTINSVPVVYAVTGGGNYCSGGSGVHVGLSNSESTVGYQLYKGATAIGGIVSGTGSALDFGLFTTAGTYTVVANPAATCAANMSGSATVAVDPLPAQYNVTGGGAYCNGGSGVHIGLDWSVSGISYQLYNGSTAVGGPVAGSSSGLDFGLITAVGTYTVRATNSSTSCVNGMNGSASVSINALPAVQTVTGGGSYCNGGTGAAIGLAGSVSGTNYQLYNGASSIGSPVAGTGAAISFGNQTGTGTYTVLATNTSTSCTNAMSGSATISVNPLPTVYTVTGGGGYCAGGSGVPVGMSNSTAGINYQLYNGASAVGSAVAGNNAAISFGNQTTSGTYTVLATNTSTTCANAMSGNAVVSINPLPSTFNVTGGGSYCPGGTGVSVGLANSTPGINYQLYNGASAVGAPVAGAASALDFGLQTAPGTYTVMATNATNSCTNAMTGSANVSINSVPTAYAVTGGGSYCSGSGGVPVGMANSTSGVDYQLYRGAATVGSPVSGTGAAISFGNKTAAGTYTVMATNATTSCTNAMSGSAVITVQPLPALFTVTGGGSLCAGGTGQNVGLSGSTVSNMSYQLYNGASTVGSPVAGTGSALDFGPQTAAGTYTILATNTSTTCTRAMTGSATVVVNPLPTSYTVTGGGTYCNGASGVAIGVGNSTVGINYQLYRGSIPVGGTVAGTGSAIAFGNQTIAGTYTVLATDASTSCVNAMSGSATIGINPMPNIYNMTGGGAYCTGGTGVHVGLSFSSSGIDYQLYRGSTAIGSVANGTGAALDFGLQTVAGTYTVSATNQITGCTIDMSGNSVVTINSLPSVFNVNGGGNYCAGGSGVPVGMAATSTGVNYQLYRGAAAIGTPVAGTGSALNFGSQTTAGTYTVLATTTFTGCNNNMGGSATVSINALPTAFTVGGGGSYCNGTGGVNVSLSGTASGINYQLYNGSATVGSAVAGTGSSINFGLQTAAGTYSVSAVDVFTGCTNGMSGTATVNVNPLPAAYVVTGGGNYCTGGTGVTVGLSNSETGINYQLYLGGTAIGSPVAGTGTAVTLSSVTVAGTYSVAATNAATGCTNNMTGSATVVVNAMPSVFVVTGGGAYCVGGVGPHVGTNNSATGINYQLYNGASPVGGPVAGSTGMGLDFGAFNTVGTYSVIASNPTTGCAIAMSGTATVSTNPLPTAFAVSGGGSYCAGGTGVSVGLNGSATGVNYQLYNGSTAVGTVVSGTGGVLSFGIFTSAGTYTVGATNSTTGCANNMSGNAVISINALPTVYAVTGGGNFCAGGAGSTVGLGNSTIGTNYQLYRSGFTVGGPVAGTGSVLNFGTFGAAGVYTVSAVNPATGCGANMTGSATIGVNALPAVFTVGGGGAYCNGGTGVNVNISGSASGVNYQLYNGSTTVGSPMAGTGVAIDFGMQTAAGSYTVFATNASSGCTSNMAGNATVVVNAVPTIYATIGGGSYCSGGSGRLVGVSGSNTGINYQLYRGSIAVGSAVAGTGSALSFGPQTGAGTYTVLATNASTSCTANMTGTPVISINTTPSVFNVTGGGGYCVGGTGVAVGLSGSASGVNYTLYNGGTAVSVAVPGTGSAISFGPQLSAGTYTVSATSATSTCGANMNGSASIIVNTPPTAYTVTGGGLYCSGGTGIAVGLTNSSVGVNYQLYNGSAAVGTAVPGTGSVLSFGPQTNTGVYSVVATNSTSGCTTNMTGSAVIGTYPIPVAYNVTGGGAYCQGGIGVTIGLNASNAGVSYQLYNGASTTGSAVLGTGSAISFGSQTAVGTYSVLATSTTSGCTNAMNSSADVIINPLPSAYVVTGGGNYCSGGAGVTVGLSSSSAGINYQLYNGSSLAGSPIVGTGGSLDFGMQMAIGTYTVLATDATTLCTSAMTGSTTVGINALPAVYNVIGGGNYCAGGTGSIVGLNNTEAGVDYQLYRGSSAVGSTVAGTGASISFGSQLVAGVYSVSATNSLTGCNNNMAGTTSVGINVLPAVYSVAGGGNYCAGGTGVSITLSGSNSGINYRLYNGGTASGTIVAGTGSGINFGLQAGAGTYTVQAVNATTGCVNNMTGSATISVNPLPTAYAVTGGGNYCAGGAGIVIGLGNSNTGVNYQLFNGAVSASPVTAGTGSSLSFGAQMGAGTYTVVAADNGTGCVNAMAGSAVVTVNALPLAYNVTGGGSYCAGGTGVNVSLSNSTTGVNYQLYNGTTTVGSAVAGTGAAISFGSQMAAGSYSVLATNTSTGCIGGMTGIAPVMINSLPSVYNVTGGGSYCTGGSGVAIGLENTSSSDSYQLYNGTTAIGGPVAGTGSAISFGLQLTAGTYNVKATTNTTGCSTNMAGTTSISTNAAPTVYTVSGGGNYCAGGTGVHILLSGSNSGIDYQVYRGITPVGSPVAGTGSALDLGAVLPAGTYTVAATNASTSCTSAMTGSAAVNVNTAPATFFVTGGGNYCAGSGGATVGLSGSESGIAYQLYIGTTPVGSPIPGTGSAISFGLQPVAGAYAVTATNTTTGCNSSMSGSATVAISPLPALYTITGGGNYCAGTPGVHVGLTGSSTTDHYQLYNGITTVGTPVAGTGTAIDFGVFNSTGTYSVVALNSTMTCGRNMTGTVSVGVNALPTVYAVNGGGGYCAGGTGVHVGMANSASGINYQLYNGTAVVGSPVAGSGSSIDFGLQTASGTYTVLATNTTTGCSRSMSSTAMVSINALPSAFSVTGGGNYCESGAGVAVGLGGSTSGINYQLYNAGSAIGVPVGGSGSALSFGLQTLAGTYTVVATNASTTCTRSMTGSATVSITPSVTPSVSIVKTSASDTICQGTAVTFSAMPVNGGATPAYQWRVNGTVVGAGSAYSYAPANHDVITAMVTSSAACALPATVTHSVTMTVNPTHAPVVAVALSPNDTVCRGTSVTFTATPSYGGTTPVFAWIKNGINVGSGTTYTYVPSNGDLVYCGMISNYTCRTVDNVSSSMTNMVVNEPPVPVVTILANPGTTISKGESVSFSAVVTNGGANPTFQWKLNGNAITGATSSTFTGNGFDNSDVVSCDVTSSGTCGGATSSGNVTLTVSTVGIINVAAANIDVNVMPNPNKGEFTVKGDLATKDDVEVTLEVVNMLGQTIYSNKVMANRGSINEHIKLDNTLANGMYMLNLRSAAGSKVFHVVVEQ